jgi:hypothetical protein
MIETESLGCQHDLLCLYELTNNITSRRDGIGSFTPSSNDSADGDRLVLTDENYHSLKQNEVGFEGGRVVENLITASENFNHAIWAEDGADGTIADNGDGTGTMSMAATSTSDVYVSYVFGAGSVGRTFIVSVELKDLTGGDGDATDFILWNAEYTTVYRDSTSVNLGESGVITSEWKRFSVSHTVTDATSTNLRFLFRGANTSAAQTLQVRKPQIEESTGRADLTTPSEYVSSSHNSVNTTGVQVFTYENPLSVTDNIVTDTGTRTPITVKGATFEPTATNLITQPRDLTHTDWTIVGGGTAALNAVGITGAPNSATTATDDNVAAWFGRQKSVTVLASTNEILFSVMIPKDISSSITAGFTGSLHTGGTVTEEVLDIDVSDGSVGVSTTTGAGFSDYGSIAQGDWWLLWGTMTNTNNTVAAIIVYPALGTINGTLDSTQTDSKVFDAVSIQENKTYPSSPIIKTGGHTRPSSTGTIPEENINNASHSFTVTWTAPFGSGDKSGETNLITKGASKWIAYDHDNTQFEVTDGTNTAVVSSTFVKGQTIVLKVIADTPSDVLQISKDGTAGTATSYDDALPSGDLTFVDGSFKLVKAYRRSKGVAWL